MKGGEAPAPPDGLRLTLDAEARRLDGGRVLLGGSPVRLMRLSAAGTAVVDRLVGGEPVGDVARNRPAVRRLIRRLLDAGIAQPCPSGGPSTADVTVVIPVKDRAGALGRAIDALGRVGEVIVVDDGSSDDSGDVARRAGARVLRRERSGGPAAARNLGLQSATTPIVAFVDSDCVPVDGWLAPLLAHFADPAVVAVAPRIVAPRTTDPNVLARYEAARSPLDLGPLAAPVRPRSRVPYVPSAALVVRREVVAGLGGFDETLHFGEDVDLVWRLVDAGGTVRYEPASQVVHEHRERLVPLLARRVGYGSSAAPLSRRHPGALAPLQVSPWSALSWALTGLGVPAAGVTVAAVTTALLPRKLDALDHPWREGVRLAGLGHWHAGRLVADAVMRAWLPVAVVAALVSKRGRRALALCAVVPGLLEWRQRQPGIDPVRYVGLRALDDAAYCAGVWKGCVSERTVAPLVPDLSSGPRVDRNER